MFAPLTESQQTALRVFQRGGTAEDARAQANVPHESVTAWLRDPAFQTALQAARADLWLETIGQLQMGAARGVETLLELMQSCNDARIRLRAAQVLIQLAAKARQDEDRRLERARRDEQKVVNPATKRDMDGEAAASPTPSEKMQTGVEATKGDKTRHAPALPWEKMGEKRFSLTGSRGVGGSGGRTRRR